ncbi:hypothetical protein [Nocardiopsis coralliicola]
MKIARWKTAPRKTPRLHATLDGIKTGCGALIPEHATLTRDTEEWFLHTTCYNCAYRLWDAEAEAGHIRPANSRDFPPRKKCEHGSDPRTCAVCTPPKPVNWPCPNGCAEQQGHMGWTVPPCAVLPPKLPPGPDGTCVGPCQPIDTEIERANRNLRFDFADRYHLFCYHCGNEVDFGAGLEGWCG